MIKIPKEYLIGTGGWAYFNVPRLNPLMAYSRVFNFVETNSTFYNIPPIKKVERWRKLVPNHFQFSVRAHRSITHENKLKPTTETLDTLEKILHICRILKADVLHIETPEKLTITQKTQDNLEDLLNSVELATIRVALEMRSTKQLPHRLLKFMQDKGIIHCVDLSKNEKPAYESDILYTRLFGKGKHNIYQPTDEELEEIHNKVTFSKAEKAKVSFHFIRMYKDAARLKIYKQTNEFPSLTDSTGLCSLGEILGEDAVFPAEKQEIVETQGWKVFDYSRNERRRASDFLQMLPKRTYKSVDDVVLALKARTSSRVFPNSEIRDFTTPS